jgi:hypothetical protein
MLPALPFRQRRVAAVGRSALLVLAGLALAPLLIGPRVAAAEPAQAPGVSQRLAESSTSLPRCLGDTRSLIISSGMPYTPVRVQGFTGFFVVDLGADGSSISPTTFLTGRGPVPLPGSVDRFAGFDFFGPWAPVRFSVQDQSGIQGPLRQAGLIGTDLISDHVLTLDYANGLLHRSSRTGFCGDAQLRRAGFQPLSSRDYYGEEVAKLRCPAAPRTGSCPNIPTIPVRIGQVQAVAQVDTGYDDGLHAPSLNINQALLERIQASGLRLVRLPAADLRLSSCVPGQQEAVLAYQLPTEGRVELLGSEAQVVRRLNGVTLFLKNSPPAIQRCGGIGTWRHPAAQLGASFVNDGTLVVDPFSQRLWFRGPLERGPGAPEDAHGAPR